MLRFTGHLLDILKVFQGQNEKIPVLSGSPALFAKTACYLDLVAIRLCAKNYENIPLTVQEALVAQLDTPSEIRRLRVQPPPRSATFFHGD